MALRRLIAIELAIDFFLDGGGGFRFKNRMIRETPSVPSTEELIALIAALRAENAALKPGSANSR